MQDIKHRKQKQNKNVNDKHIFFNFEHSKKNYKYFQQSVVLILNKKCQKQ